MENSFTIGKLAKEAGVDIQTVYFYEKKGLISPVGRKPSGYRIYDGESLKRLLFIGRGKLMGFTLSEIKDLLALSSDSDESGSCDKVRSQAEVKLRQVEEKIKALMSVKKVLGELINTCANRNPTDKCPILRSMGQE